MIKKWQKHVGGLLGLLNNTARLIVVFNKVKYNEILLLYMVITAITRLYWE